MISINMNHNIGSYVMIHVIKHDMDPNSNINYRRKIGPLSLLRYSSNINLNMELNRNFNFISDL